MRNLFSIFIALFFIGCTTTNNKSANDQSLKTQETSKEQLIDNLIKIADTCLSCQGSTNPGGPCYSGPGGQISTNPGGSCYNGPGGNLYAGPGGNCYSGPGGNCNAGPGGNCAGGPNKKDCPKVCNICTINLIRAKR